MRIVQELATRREKHRASLEILHDLKGGHPQSRIGQPRQSIGDGLDLTMAQFERAKADQGGVLYVVGQNRAGQFVLNYNGQGAIKSEIQSPTATVVLNLRKQKRKCVRSKRIDCLLRGRAGSRLGKSPPASVEPAIEGFSFV